MMNYGQAARPQQQYRALNAGVRDGETLVPLALDACVAMATADDTD